MELKGFKMNQIDDAQLSSILGGTDIFGEDSGFIIEDDILVVDFIGEEDGGI